MLTIIIIITIILILLFIIFLIYKNYNFCKNFVQNQQQEILLTFFFFFILIKFKKNYNQKNLNFFSQIQADNVDKNDSNLIITKEDNFLSFENHVTYFANETTLNFLIFSLLSKKTNLLILETNNVNIFKRSMSIELRIFVIYFEKYYLKELFFKRLQKNFIYLNCLINDLSFIFSEDKTYLFDYQQEIMKLEDQAFDFPFGGSFHYSIDAKYKPQIDYLTIFIIYCQLEIILSKYHKLAGEKFKKDNSKFNFNQK